MIAKYESTNQSITSVVNHYRTPRLSEGLIVGEKINETKINSLMEILFDYINISNTNNCSAILVRATNAFRVASNSNEIIKRIKEKYSLDIEIISSDEEARLTFLGSAFPFTHNESKTVIDIGGGSTEIICGSKKEIIYKTSFDIGVVSLTEKFFPTLPPFRSRYSCCNKVHQYNHCRIAWNCYSKCKDYCGCRNTNNSFMY